MGRRISRGLAVVVLVALFATGAATAPATAQDFQTGLAAAKRGDYATAFKAFRVLARRDHVPAQFHLGFMYANALGVPQDDVAGEKWFRLAAERGHGLAQYNLGLIYAQGRGVPRDDGQAVAWWRMAAEQGIAGAQYYLGVRYAQGQGVRRDEGEAEAWFRKAARQGHGNAKRSLRFLGEKRRRFAGKAPKRTRQVATKAPLLASGHFRVQLSALKSKASAMTEARRLARVHKPVLAGLEIGLVRADLGKRGVFYRLRAGPFRTRTAAGSLCRKLSFRNQGCFVITP